MNSNWKINLEIGRNLHENSSSETIFKETSEERNHKSERNPIPY